MGFNKKEYQKEYMLKNRHKYKEYDIKYVEKAKENNKILYQQNKEEKLQKCKIYYLNNINKRAEYSKIYFQNNKHKINELRKNSYKQSPNQKIRHSITPRINKCLKGNKQYSIIKYIGCSIDEFKQHLEKQFTSEMSWDNYGKNKYWEIDHIKPISSFNLLVEEEIFKCFNYLNCQPLTIKENRSKGGRYES